MGLAMIELRHLHSFLVLAEEGHVGRAAARLGIEQSPLSRRLQSLEKAVGAKLFDRTARGITLTPAGREFRAGGLDEWTTGGVNEPLSDGDRLRTGADSQAEIHVAATVVHLAPQTDLTMALLDDRVFRMNLVRGALNIGSNADVANHRHAVQLGAVLI